MIRYAGNLDFKEQPGSIGPNQSESGLDVLTRTFIGKTSLRETVFNPALYTPDYKYPQLFSTNIEVTDTEGGLSEYRVTYKGMLSGQPRPATVTDALITKSSTLTAEYVYDILLPADENYRYDDGYSGPSLGGISESNIERYLVLEWQRRSAKILATVSYYAPSTTYTYTRRNRPTAPEYGMTGANGANNPVYIFDKIPSGEVQITKPQVLVGSASGALQASIERYINTPPKFAEIRLTAESQNKRQVCTNFNAQQEGLWWVVTETWEVELEPAPPDPVIEYEPQ
jgi:hypothetical protein